MSNAKDEKKIAETIGSIAASVSKTASNTSEKAKEVMTKSQEAVINVIDQNGNGEIDIEDIIIMGLRVPGIRINRSEFLQKEFMKKYSQDVIDDAIAYNPAHANILPEDIDKIADTMSKAYNSTVFFFRM